MVKFRENLIFIYSKTLIFCVLLTPVHFQPYIKDAAIIIIIIRIITVQKPLKSLMHRSQTQLQLQITSVFNR